MDVPSQPGSLRRKRWGLLIFIVIALSASIAFWTMAPRIANVRAPMLLDEQIIHTATESQCVLMPPEAHSDFIVVVYFQNKTLPPNLDLKQVLDGVTVAFFDEHDEEVSSGTSRSDQDDLYFGTSVIVGDASARVRRVTCVLSPTIQWPAQVHMGLARTGSGSVSDALELATSEAAAKWLPVVSILVAIGAGMGIVCLFMRRSGGRNTA